MMTWLVCLLATAGLLVPIGMARADEKTDPAQNPARQKAVAWIKKNSRFGVDAPIVTNTIQGIDNAVKADMNFAVSFGARLLTGGSPVQIVSWDDELLVIPLTPEQAREMNFGEMSVTQTSPPKDRSKRERAEAVKLQAVKFDKPSDIDGSKSLAGELTCEIIGAVPDQPAVRVSYFTGPSSTCSGYAYPGNLQGRGVVTVKFSVPPVNPKTDQADAKRHYGPLPVFVDICTFKDEGGERQARVISNSIANVITVRRP